MNVIKKISEGIDKAQQSAIVFFAVSLSALALVFYLIFTPAFNQARLLSKQIKEKNIDLARVQTPSKELGLLEEEVGALKEKADTIKKKLFWSKDINQFVSEINKLASGLNIDFVTFRNEPAIAMTAKEKKDFSKYAFTRVPVSVRIRSNYGNLVNFLRNIEQADKLIQIDSLSVEADARDISKHVIDIKFSVITKEEEAKETKG